MEAGAGAGGALPGQMSRSPAPTLLSRSAPQRGNSSIAAALLLYCLTCSLSSPPSMPAPIFTGESPHLLFTGAGRLLPRPPAGVHAGAACRAGMHACINTPLPLCFWASCAQFYAAPSSPACFPACAPPLHLWPRSLSAALPPLVADFSLPACAAAVLSPNHNHVPVHGQK